MTAEELRRLAEIAGFSISKYYSDFYTKNISKRKEIAIMVKDWRPHLRIEQAMMVAEAFDCYEIGKDMSSAAPYWCQFFTGVGGPMIGQAIGMELPYAICRAALAAMEG